MSVIYGSAGGSAVILAVDSNGRLLTTHGGTASYGTLEILQEVSLASNTASASTDCSSTPYGRPCLIHLSSTTANISIELQVSQNNSLFCTITTFTTTGASSSMTALNYPNGLPFRYIRAKNIAGSTAENVHLMIIYS